MFGVNSVVSPHRAESEAMSRLYAVQSTFEPFHSETKFERGNTVA